MKIHLHDPSEESAGFERSQKRRDSRPATLSTDACHLRQAVRKQSAESATECRRTEEDGLRSWESDARRARRSPWSGGEEEGDGKFVSLP